MKRIIALISALLMIFSLASCHKPPQADGSKSDPAEIAQADIIAGFGITQKDSRIVAYTTDNGYLKYIVAYYEDGVKTNEFVHFFYTNDEYFDSGTERFKNAAGVTMEKEKRYLSYRTLDLNTGSYDTDLEFVKKSYTVK